MMNPLSLAARRSATMATSRRVPTAIATRSSAFSTQTHAEVEAVESMMARLHWADLKDNVAALRNLMNELKTNHALRKPDNAMENKLANEMRELQKAVANSGSSREAVQSRITTLKANMKQHMYA